jgi:hypothetical protein
LRKSLALAALCLPLLAGCFPAQAPDELRNQPFLVCTRAHESDGAGGYQAYNRSGPYLGAYQFLQSTWNATAHHGGYPWLVGVDPRHATDHEQDVMAWELYLWQGKAPWGGRC